MNCELSKCLTFLPVDTGVTVTLPGAEAATVVAPGAPPPEEEVVDDVDDPEGDPAPSDDDVLWLSLLLDEEELNSLSSCLSCSLGGKG